MTKLSNQCQALSSKWKLGTLLQAKYVKAVAGNTVRISHYRYFLSEDTENNQISEITHYHEKQNNDYLT